MTARRPRPPAPPLDVQLAVAMRQLGDRPDLIPGYVEQAAGARDLGARLAAVLPALALKLGCQVKDLRLDHEPALRVRTYNPRKKKIADRYTPHAHDPACLAWRPHGREFAGSHDVKTNVRGDHGQFSDVVLIKRERRREKAKAQPKHPECWYCGGTRQHRPTCRAIFPAGRKLQGRPFPKRST